MRAILILFALLFLALPAAAELPADPQAAEIQAAGNPDYFQPGGRLPTDAELQELFGRAATRLQNEKPYLARVGAVTIQDLGPTAAPSVDDERGWVGIMMWGYW